MATMTYVLGVDACTKGWVGIRMGSDDHPMGHFAATIAELVALATADESLAAVAIDIPIALPESAPRESDGLARARLGPRRSSLFDTPMRAAITCETFAEANATNRALCGRGLSVQSYGLRARILDVQEWLAVEPEIPVIEVHPETSFALAHGAPLAHTKKSWAGMRLRTAILASVGLILPNDLGQAGDLGSTDDVLDAAIAAWSAHRFTEGIAERLPAEPRSELAPAIWV
ncbi:MAG: hypothetical protein JWP10_1677 [Nocardioidaceae bacterium]|nr:hypothetical protein [Nocardioidaceae bacterium]